MAGLAAPVLLLAARQRFVALLTTALLCQPRGVAATAALPPLAAGAGDVAVRGAGRAGAGVALQVTTVTTAFCGARAAAHLSNSESGASERRGAREIRKQKKHW